MEQRRDAGLIGLGATGLSVLDNAVDLRELGRNGVNILRQLHIPPAFRKPLALSMDIAPVGTLATTAAQVAGTDTSDHYRRFGMQPLQGGSPERQFVADVGVRTLGAASEVAPSFFDPIGQGDAIRRRLFRDRQ